MNLRELVQASLAEDIGHGDVTTECTIPADAVGTAEIVAKADLVVAGHAAAAMVFAEVPGGPVDYEIAIPDGKSAVRKDVVARLRGPVRAIVTGERCALNFLMRLSGIATNTRAWVAAAEGKLKVVDTRKTTPLHRDLEKAAVRAGGGFNHRHALFDGVLIKDNHVVAAGGAARAVRAAKSTAHHLLKIECEVTRVDQIREAIEAGADALLLDNMDDATLLEAIRVARAADPRVILEASGNMSPERIGRIREFGLDLVSAGGLVHQAKWVDLSLELLS